MAKNDIAVLKIAYVPTVGPWGPTKGKVAISASYTPSKSELATALVTIARQIDYGTRNKMGTDRGEFLKDLISELQTCVDEKYSY